MNSIIEILEKAAQKNINLDDSNVALFEQILYSYSNSDSGDVNLLCIIKWCQRILNSFKIDQKNTSAAVFAMHTLKILLPKSPVEPNSEFHYLIREIFNTLEEIITSFCFKNSNNGYDRELIILFYQIHIKCSMELEYSELLKTYNLWRPLISFYVESDKFDFLIQNSCIEYINNLVLKGDTPSRLRLVIEIIDLIAYNIKMKVKINDFNDQVILRCLKLMNKVLPNQLLNLTGGSFHIISKKCRSLKTQIWQIAKNTTKDTIMKYSLNIYILLEVNTSAVDSVLDQIVYAVVSLMEHDKFVPFIPEILIMFDSFFEKMDSHIDFLNLLIIVQAETCSIYLQHLSESSLPDLIETKRESTKFEKFIQVYRQKIMIIGNLSNVVDSILKTICDTSTKWNTVIQLCLIDFLHAILKNNRHYDVSKWEELRNILLNVEFVLIALLSTVRSIHVISDQLYDEILKTSTDFITITDNGSLKIRLAAFKICRLVVNRTGMTSSNLNTIFHAVVSSLSDINWEIRDSSLELINEILQNSRIYNHFLADSSFCESFSRTLIDDESYVRETSYNVLSNLVCSYNKYIDKHFNYEFLALETTQRFSLESDDNVREKMIIFILRFWQRFKIKDTVLLTEIYKTVFEASTNDLHSEVRVAGMLFWLEFVKKIPINDIEATELFDGLSSIGCLQAVVNAVNDEYDPEVKKLAFRILILLEPFRAFFEDKGNGNTHSNKCGGIAEIRSDELDNVFPKVISHQASHSFVNGESFFKICQRREMILYEIECEKKKSVDIGELLDNFVKISCDSNINEKDCY